MAAKNGHLPVIQYLCEHTRADVPAGNNYVVRLAEKNGHTEVVQYLKDR